ncbi:Carboxymethylenebutenolidase [Serratia entomophila]|jgi:carboxymethylenebutenolidase|uniref:Dienelactone hydrolase family protein n=1 Tax=Serratia entomophila TaxID=42906 RepID=A0ABY5CTB9_9GAMM|nr:dienelactone hydrolase family protein [Serratia entomophila]UIW18072.1 dienelactone hydrolase family protein [Serratia entomophila]USV01174.1 dienelactone hydrolase family protein [Serratia entomophila]CAI0898903.1 Carboxymethylenebutenolidase [Serratia entomophila]CAI0939614.1 Carboxymethylenebutenolidase [Serratia entomophila]CAI1004932.1 Carboxymethylenebutenolidase [Serratia entomophila]
MKTEHVMTLKQAQGGFAPAAAPLAASAILTDEQGIHAGQTTIPSQGDELPAYIAKPADHSGPFPVVLVVQEIFGVHEHIQDLCRRLAKQGYLAIAPELYFRQGDANDYTDIAELFQQLVSKVPDRQVLSDLDHAAHWATRHGGDAGKLAITGFCWGGRITWLYAAHNPQLKAAVAWYGKLVGEKTLNSPKQPVDVAIDLSAPVLGLYGGQDSSIPQETVETMRQAIRAANAEAEIVVYPEAGHAFNADYRPSYHAEAAADGWQRMLDWFAQHGVAGVK